MLLAEALIESFGSPESTGRWSLHIFFELVISILAIFLILLVLVQRGRGGGLAGALGGMGGQSAFGTRAGDTFTWITYITAAIWILLAMLTIKVFTDPAADRKAMLAEKSDNQSLTEEGATAIPRGKVDDTSSDTMGDGGSDALSPAEDDPLKTDDAPASDSTKTDESTRAEPKGETSPPGDAPAESKSTEEPKGPAPPEPSTTQPEE